MCVNPRRLFYAPWRLGPGELAGVSRWRGPPGVSLEEERTRIPEPSLSFILHNKASHSCLRVLTSSTFTFVQYYSRSRPLPVSNLSTHVPQHLQRYNIRHQDVLQDSPSQRSLRSCGCSVCCPHLHQRAQPDHRRPGPGYHLCDQRHHQREYLVRHCNMANNGLTSHSP